MGIDAINSQSTYSSYQGSDSTFSSQKDIGNVKVNTSRELEEISLDTQDKDAVLMNSIVNNDQLNGNEEQIKKTLGELNGKLDHSEAIFGIHEETNRVMIKIVDKNTKEVIKEFPPEKTLDMIAKVWELAGLLVDEKR